MARNKNSNKTQAQNVQTQTALPEGRNMVTTDNLLETAQTPAEAQTPKRVYSSTMFERDIPRAALLAADILSALGSGKMSTCSIYNYLRDVSGWSGLPGSIRFRSDTSSAGLLVFTDTKGKDLVKTNTRTKAVMGPMLTAIVAEAEAAINS